MRPDIVPVGSLPPLGTVPKKMHAQVIRQNRYGEPETAIQQEVVTVPEIQNDEVLVAVMAAGINYNNIWAALGYPLDIIEYRKRKGSLEDFHIGGSELSGIVYSIGSAVKSVSVGDHIVIQSGVWQKDDPEIISGGDTVLAKSFQAWGYEVNWGSFAQFAPVKEYQCLKKPEHLTWEEAAVYLLSGATAYRMLHHWNPNTIHENDVVLIWGGAGGLGCMAIQLVKEAGGIPVAVVSSDQRQELCLTLGAKGVLNRNNYSHWGILPSENSKPDEFLFWKNEVKKFKSDLEKITTGKLPSIVIEHSGENTIPTSLFVCNKGGMVVTCGGTTGYTASFDLRHLWMFQKRIQGSHFADINECDKLNNLILSKKIRPVLAETFPFEKTGFAHQLMKENIHPPGNMAILIGSNSPGLGVK